MHVIRHDDEGMERTQPLLGGRGLDLLHDAQGNPWVGQPNRSDGLPVHLTIQVPKSTAVPHAATSVPRQGAQ